MNLRDLVQRADKVVRVTVLDVSAGTVSAGGGDLPTVTYRLKVEESFKGDAAEGKGAGVLEVRMLGTAKAARTEGNVRKLSFLQDVPELRVGQDYVLFTTRPSSAGLSTTVGLGQGAFTITGSGKSEEQALNAFGNAGLFRGMSETGLASGRPVSYAQLAQAIRAVTGK
jgi:hypothetical protein